MRKRISIKIDINAIGLEIKNNQDRKRSLFREALRDVCERDNIRIGEAKKTLKSELKWQCIKRSINILHTENYIIN